MREYIEDRVNDYIQDEIDFLKREEETCGFDRGRFGELLSLEILKDSTQEKNKIVDNILDDTDLEQAINVVIHYYLYHR